MAEGLVRGEGFATDASLIKANAQCQRGVSGDEVIDWGNPEEAARPVREYLACLEKEPQGWGYRRCRSDNREQGSGSRSDTSDD